MPKVLLLFLLLGFWMENVSAQFTITEIMYNPPESGTDSLEYIELMNTSTSNQNLSGCSLVGVTYTFPNLVIKPAQRIIIAENKRAVKSVFGVDAQEWTSGSLVNSGEGIALKKGTKTIDTVYYDNSTKFPASANGLGASLTLCYVSSDNNLPHNWTASAKYLNKTINGYNLYADPLLPCGRAIKIINQYTLNQNTLRIVFNTSLLYANGKLSNFNSALGIKSIQRSKNGDTFTIQCNTNFKVAKWMSITMNSIKDTFDNEVVNGLTIPFVYNPLMDKISISEIMYDNPGTDYYEFIELFNYSTDTLSLLGLSIQGDIQFPFPDIKLLPGRYYVICNDSIRFRSYYFKVANEWKPKQYIPNNYGKLILSNSNLSIIDSLTYFDRSPWSSSAGGGGKSIAVEEALKLREAGKV